MTLEEKIRRLSPEKKAEVEEFVDGLSSSADSPANEEQGAAGIIALFGTIDYYPEYDYKAVRRKDQLCP